MIGLEGFVGMATHLTMMEKFNKGQDARTLLLIIAEVYIAQNNNIIYDMLGKFSLSITTASVAATKIIFTGSKVDSNEITQTGLFIIRSLLY